LDPSTQQYFEIFRVLVFIGLVAWAAYMDTRHGRLPNEMNAAGVLVGVALGFAVGGTDGFFTALLGVVIGCCPLLVIYLIGVASRKPLMGAGDVKLMAALGAFTGAWLALLTLVYALAIAGMVALSIVLVQVVRRKPLPRTIPFGAMLCAGAVVVFVLHSDVFAPHLF